MKKRLRGSSERKRIEYGGDGEGAGEDMLYVPLLNGALVKVKSKWMAELEARKRSVRIARETDAAIRSCVWNRQTGNYGYRDSCGLSRRLDLLRLLVGRRDG